MSEKKYKINAYAQDPESIKKRTNYASGLLRDITAKAEIEQIKQTMGLDLYSTPDQSSLPETEEEISIHMQLKYKPSIEIAEEEVINNTLDKNKFELIRRRLNYDLTVLGIAAVKTELE